MISHEARRQGLQQENPCPGDVVVFTCTRSETSPGTVSWYRDGLVTYTFIIPGQVNTANAVQTSIPGLTGVLVSETISTLQVDLNTTNIITNGTQVSCGEIGLGRIEDISLNIIGILNAHNISIN